MIDQKLLLDSEAATPGLGRGIFYLGADGLARVKLHDGSVQVARGIKGDAGAPGAPGAPGEPGIYSGNIALATKSLAAAESFLLGSVGVGVDLNERAVKLIVALDTFATSTVALSVVVAGWRLTVPAVACALSRRVVFDLLITRAGTSNSRANALAAVFAMGAMVAPVVGAAAITAESPAITSDMMQLHIKNGSVAQSVVGVNAWYAVI